MANNSAASAATGAAEGSILGPIGSVVSGALGALGGIVSANKSSAQAKDAMQMQMDWEALKAQNAHTWEVADLKKAGLNPILSALNGNMPGGISAVTGDTSGYQHAGNQAMNALQMAMQIKSLKKQWEQQDADIQEKNALTDLHKAQTLGEALNNDLSSARNAAEIPALTNEATYNNSPVGKWLQWTGKGIRELTPALNLIGFGLGGMAAKKMLGGAVSAFKGKKAIQQVQQIKNNFPTGWKSPGLKPREQWEHVPAVYRNGYKSH